jgi:basic membrane protein A
MSYHNVEGDSFKDPECGAAEARNQLVQGADIIFGAGGMTGIAVLRTVAESPEAAPRCFASVSMWINI